ncbi:MAG: hypothetical protein HDS66_09355 [Bacteroidales bacterium]|nr:hypothetical protein [Bacteroidales bacterium]
MYFLEEGLISREQFINKLLLKIPDFQIIRDNKRKEYYNIPAAFDIEVSSFYQGEKLPENKRAIMYIWQFGLYNLVTYGRTWGEFISFIKLLKKILDLSDERRLLVYVHNLPYEFQFIRKRLLWEEVFLLSERKPVYANAHGIEFRCSLKLAGGKSLANVGNDLQKYKVSKAVGNLDYNIIRTPLTPLTEKELLYCENDIRVLLSYIQEKIEQDGDITKIPLTNTGYVRNYCRKECFSRWKPYHTLMSNLTLEPDEFSQLKRAFQGGFTHANSNYVRKVMENVGSHDFASSYPAAMVLDKFPMSKAEKITDGINEDEFFQLLLSRACLFDIELWDVMPKVYQDHPISKYKCWICENAVIDNGRVVMASHIGTTITEQDFFVYMEFYSWERMAIKNLKTYQKAYLPTKFVLSILNLYVKKTTLKDVEGEEINYMLSKNMINAGYGMMVTNPIRDNIEYQNGVFHTIHQDLEEGIEKYNKNIRRFLYYPWGVWVTAYARANLFSGILELGSDYIYSDTDSVKSINTEKHQNYFEAYNRGIMEKIHKSAKFHKISEDLYYPQTPTGKRKPIGFWDDEGIYEKFKTLGAKRYLTFRHESRQKQEEDGTLVQWTEPVYMITLAGSNKSKTAAFLRNTKDAFNNFDNDLIIPPENSGRLTLTYIDEETEGDVVDCNGVPYHYHELSSIHMEPSEYHLGMSEEFIRYIEEVQDFSE